MKKLLTILAISTFTIVPSITLVSCFNETTPKFFTFNDSDPIGSINKAVTNRNLKLSAGDFITTSTAKEDIVNGKVANGMDSIINEISNSFTKVEDIISAKTWLNDSALSILTPSKEDIIPGEDISIEISEKVTESGKEIKSTFIEFEVQEGYSFNWLKDSKDKENFFLGGKTTDFTNVNKKDSFRIQSYLISSFNNDKLDTKEGVIIRESAAKEIYSALISQSISTIKNKSKSGWEEFNKLNSSTVIFENGDKKEMKSFTKGNVSSITDFIITTARYNNTDLVTMLQPIVDALDKKENKDNGVEIETNLFKFNTATTKTNEQYKFKVVKE